MNNKSWKTTLAGALTGGGTALYALIDAIQQGQFTGKTGTTLLVSIGLFCIGYLSKDKDKTGLPTKL